METEMDRLLQQQAQNAKEDQDMVSELTYLCVHFSSKLTQKLAAFFCAWTAFLICIC